MSQCDHGIQGAQRAVIASSASSRAELLSASSKEDVTWTSYCPAAARTIVVKLRVRSPWMEVTVIKLAVRIILNWPPGI